MWHDETRRTVPAGTVEDQQSDGTDADAVANFNQMLVHGRDADGRHDQRGAGAARRADGAEQVGPGEPSEPPVALDPRTRAALGPDAGQRALLANAGFILKPNLDRPAGKLPRDRGAASPAKFYGMARPSFRQGSLAGGSNGGVDHEDS